MKYAVVIPSLFEVDGEYLKLCVESLRTSGFGGQVIVVTNGTKASPDLSHIRGITIHLHSADQGQCLSVNLGAQAVSPDTDYIMVSNSDMYYAPGWNISLGEWMFEHYPVFSPNLIEPEGNAGSAPPFKKLDAGVTLETFDKSRVDKYVTGFVGGASVRSQESGLFPGFNLPFFIKRDFWNFLGGYDVAYDPWGSNSDTDLQTRINLAGVTPMRQNYALVYHFSNKTPTFAPENDKFRFHNFDYFKEKFGFDRDELKSDVWYNKDMLPEDKGRIRYDQAPYTS